MTQTDRPVEINISRIHVAGVGGLGLVAMAVLVSVVMPEAWWVMVAGVTGGVVLGTILVVVRRGRRSSGPSGDDPHVRFRSADDRQGATERAEVPADRELRTARGLQLPSVIPAGSSALPS